MQSLLQTFEFSYPGGYLFLDRGGAVCQKLRERFPQLVAKAVDRLQIDMQLPDKGLELYFGVRTASIQQTSDEGEDFGTVASEFARILAEALELSSLESFRYQQIVGRPCASLEAATALMRPLIPKETQERLGQMASETEWRAVQAEFRRNNLLFQDRIAVAEFIPRGSTSGAPTPHITVQFDIKGLEPVELSALNIKTLVQNLGRKHLEEVIARIAPHLSAS
jgi:hypothetical protein